MIRWLRHLQPLGNDGLRKWERDAMSAHYMATLGKTPTMPIAERLAAAAAKKRHDPGCAMLPEHIGPCWTRDEIATVREAAKTGPPVQYRRRKPAETLTDRLVGRIDREAARTLNDEKPRPTR